MATNANGTDSQGVTGIQVAAHCRAIIINSSTAQLPNFQTLAFVFSRRAFVDENDPTATANTTRKLANWGFGSADGANVWASSESSDSSACFVASGGNLLGMYKYLRYGVVPVLEIPA